MTLDLLIPHYKEQPEEILPLLESVAIQQSIDFNNIGVIIVFDGEEATSLPQDEWIKKFPFHITFIHSPHIGVSAARNLALDNSTADYVMFCDADDMFCHICGLYTIFEAMNLGFDTFVSTFAEEDHLPETNQIVYTPREMDSTFVHGKVHRREYLLEKNIRFNPKLTIHEDSYFNILAQNLTDKIIYCAEPFYLWKWRDASVCRHDPDYILKTYTNLLDSNDSLVSEFIKRDYEDKANFYVGFMLFDAYYTMNKKEWIDKTNQKYRDNVENRFASYYQKYKDRWEKLTEQEKMIISNNVRQRSVMEGMPMESITIDDWLNHITDIGENK